MPRSDSPVPPLTEDAGALRRADAGDVPAIKTLLDGYAARGNLLPRSVAEITRHLSEFLVWERQGKVVACGALEMLAPDLAEIRSLAVSASCVRTGIGREIALRLIERAREVGAARVMALTYVPKFFESLGFARTDRNALPEKVWSVCVNCYKFAQCDEIAVLLPLAGHPKT